MEELNNNIWQIILIPVLGWLVLTNIQHGKKLAVIETTLAVLVHTMDVFMDADTKSRLRKLAKRKDG